MSRYDVGVVGCGWVGTNRHVPGYDRDDRARLAAVYDRNAARAREVAADHGATAHDSLDAFLAADLDLVSVCTPPWTHADVATRALEAGAHVLTEKPMALSTAEAERMVDAAARTDRHLGVVHNFLFSASVREARRQWESGRLGEVRSVVGFQTSSSRRHLPSWYPRLPGGLFFDESPHLLYLMRHFLGDLAVDSASAARAPPDRDQPLATVTAGLRTSDDRVGSLTMLFDAPLSEWHVAIVGSDRLLVADVFRDVLIELDAEEAHGATDVLGVSLSAMAQETTGIVASGVRRLRGSLLYGTGELVARYLDGLDDGSGPPVAGADALPVVRTIEEILAAVGVETDDAGTGTGNG